MTGAIDLKTFARFIKTTTDVTDFQHALDLLADSLYKTDDSSAALQQALPYEQAMAVYKLGTTHGVDMTNKVAVREFLTTLKKALDDIPVVQIKLAITPKAKLVSLMHEWFYHTYRKMVILDIAVDQQVIAGSVISYNGKYYDYSLGKETEQMLL